MSRELTARDEQRLLLSVTHPKDLMHWERAMWAEPETAPTYGEWQRKHHPNAHRTVDFTPNVYEAYRTYLEEFKETGGALEDGGLISQFLASTDAKRIRGPAFLEAKYTREELDKRGVLHRITELALCKVPDCDIAVNYVAVSEKYVGKPRPKKRETHGRRQPAGPKIEELTEEESVREGPAETAESKREAEREFEEGSGELIEAEGIVSKVKNLFKSKETKLQEQVNQQQEVVDNLEGLAKSSKKDIAQRYQRDLQREKKKLRDLESQLDQARMKKASAQYPASNDSAATRPPVAFAEARYVRLAPHRSSVISDQEYRMQRKQEAEHKKKEHEHRHEESSEEEEEKEEPKHEEKENLVAQAPMRRKRTEMHMQMMPAPQYGPNYQELWLTFDLIRKGRDGEQNPVLQRLIDAVYGKRRDQFENAEGRRQYIKKHVSDVQADALKSFIKSLTDKADNTATVGADSMAALLNELEDHK